MLKRIVLLTLVLPATAAAQAPDDWTWRLDREQTHSTASELKPGEWAYARMPPGWHITTTEQGAVLFPKGRTVQGRWGIEVELFLFPNPSEAPLGIVLEEPGVSGVRQLRFLLRRDGSAMALGQQNGRDSVLAAWKKDTTVTAHDGKGVIKYVLKLTHEAGVLGFAINGSEIFAVKGVGADQVIVPGLRVGSGLNLHVSRFDLVTPLAPPRRR